MTLFNSILSLTVLVICFFVILASINIRFKRPIINFIMDFLRVCLLLTDFILTLGIIEHI